MCGEAMACRLHHSSILPTITDWGVRLSVTMPHKNFLLCFFFSLDNIHSDILVIALQKLLANIYYIV